MGNKEALQLFGEKKIRTAWNQEEEKWYFSIVDVVEVLTDSPDPAKYWRVLKTRLKKEGSETATNCSTFKMMAADGKMRQTDVADQQQLFRLIQSIPSPKAEPFKQWIAKVASERIDEIQDPELAILRGAGYYRAKGYSEGWINQADIAFRCHFVQQTVFLENGAETDGAAVVIFAGAETDRMGIPAFFGIVDDRSVICRHQSGDEVQQGSFSASGRRHQGAYAASRKICVEVFQHGLSAERFGQIPDPDADRPAFGTIF